MYSPDNGLSTIAQRSIWSDWRWSFIYEGTVLYMTTRLQYLDRMKMKFSWTKVQSFMAVCKPWHITVSGQVYYEGQLVRFTMKVNVREYSPFMTAWQLVFITVSIQLQWSFLYVGTDLHNDMATIAYNSN